MSLCALPFASPFENIPMLPNHHRISEARTTGVTGTEPTEGLLAIEHWLLIGLVFLFTYLFWPDLKPVLGIAPSVTSSSSVGTVQQVRFMDGLGYDTQVNTETHSFMVSGLAGLDRNTPLELRTQDGRRVLCVSTTNACWRVLVH
jgi:hypothetical protein